MFKFNKILSTLRQSRNISDEEMARVLNCTVGRLRLIEDGVATPPPDTFIAYATVLGMSPDELAVLHINDYAKDFCERAGIDRNIKVVLEGEPCGRLFKKVVASRYVMQPGKLLRPSEASQITGSTLDLREQK